MGEREEDDDVCVRERERVCVCLPSLQAEMDVWIRVQRAEEEKKCTCLDQECVLDAHPSSCDKQLATSSNLASSFVPAESRRVKEYRSVQYQEGNLPMLLLLVRAADGMLSTSRPSRGWEGLLLILLILLTIPVTNSSVEAWGSFQAK